MLPVAIILMLIGTPLTELFTLGPKALAAMAVATGTIFVAQVISYVALINYLPEDAWKSVGALMGTWIGGSANMVAIKEILQMPDDNLSALVIVDALLSYSWMALLLIGAKSSPPNVSIGGLSQESTRLENNRGSRLRISGATLLILIVGFAVGELCVFLGKIFGAKNNLLPINGWILLTASTVAILLALTPLQKLRTWGSPKIGTLLLYLVLITIGARTTIGGAKLQAPVFLIYGVLAFALHGILAVGLGRLFKLPRFLLATASQANIGGAVSAPVVAEAYQAGTAHIGVLMAVLGAVLGTYLGVAGGYFCRALGQWLR